MDEANILKGLRANEMDAFKELFDSLFTNVRFYTEQITKDQKEAEDIALLAFTRFWERGMTGIKTMAQVRNTIYNIAKNAAIDYLRRLKVQKSFQQQLTYLTPEGEDARSEQSHYTTEMVSALFEEIEKLPGRTKEVFKLYYLDKVSRQDIALQLGISVNTVHVLCSEALSKLRLILSEKRELLVLLLLIETTLCKN
jgi:RNA polymerase sigma factor (sigma-70 family)